LIISQVATALTSFILLWLYRRALIQSMIRMANSAGESDGIQIVETSGIQLQIGSDAGVFPGQLNELFNIAQYNIKALEHFNKNLH
jgi:hypothetical protein